MKSLQLLIVEDDPVVFGTMSDVIENFNSKNRDLEIVYKESLCKTIEEANSRLSIQYYDAAIVDLKLNKRGRADELEGQEVLNNIIDHLRFPVVVYSSNIAALDEKIRERQSEFLLLRSKDDGEFIDILNEIVGIYETGITNILGGKGKIEKYLNEIFWNHLSSSLQYWKTKKNEKTLLRYSLSHLMEYLDLNDNDELALESYIPAEFYILPPVKKRSFTGDLILDDKGAYYIVMNPACDMDYKWKNDGTGKKKPYRKADYILLIKTIEWYKLLGFETPPKTLSGNKQEELKKFRKEPRYYYMPKYGLIPGLFVDFQDKIVLPDKQLNDFLGNDTYKRIATISGNFLKDIINQYSSYYARQGAPDFIFDELVADLLAE